MAKTLLIDGNSIGYAAQQATKLNANGMETQAAFGIIKTLHKQRVQNPSFRPIVLWDGRADWRFNLHPDYKSNRKDTPEKLQMKEAYAKQRPFIGNLLRHLGITQMTWKTAEADDLAGYLVGHMASQPDTEIGLISGDEDWLQLVRQTDRAKVWWCDPRGETKLVTPATFYKHTGCLTPFAFLESKILQGDTSDVVSGVGGIGATGAPQFLAEFGSVREFWRRCDAGEFVPKLKAHKSLWSGTSPITLEEHMASAPPRDEGMDDKAYEKVLKKHRDTWPGQGRLIYKRNFQLMQLLHVSPPAKSDLEVIPGKFDKDAFADVCGELNFVSVLRKLDDFTQPFAPK
ncbi:hypothetical protein [Herbaspirillum huttiense]|uniref:5'-3' exonuclease domain-containing protein n=1 Tax=Herbaspirillum huttiense subsp. lycopersici TaxID=3074428 RepID=A0ABU2EG61_9BURK|nr:hypothetical protein [Herbaspirillum huttiense]MDR9847120.1 hypothetical protein [Herbaspirillum huttiense SE1]